MPHTLTGLVKSRTGESPLKSRFWQERTIAKSIEDGGLGLTTRQLQRVQLELSEL